MTETRADAQLEMSDRIRAVDDGRREHRLATESPDVPLPHRLTVEEAASRQASAAPAAEGVVSVTVRTGKSPRSASVDPLVALRGFQVGAFLALALAVLLVWYRLRRRR